MADEMNKGDGGVVAGNATPEPPAPPAPLAPPVPAEAVSPPQTQTRKSGLVVGAIAGFLLVAAGAAWFMLKDGSAAEGASDTGRVADIAQQPEVSWEFDFLLGMDEDYFNDVAFIPVGEDQVLVMPIDTTFASNEPEGTGDNSPRIALLDLNSGETKWTLVFADLVDAPADPIYHDFEDVKGTDFVLLSVHSSSGEGVVMVLDKSDGTVIDSIDVADRDDVDAYGSQGSLYLATSNSDTYAASLQRFDGGKISEEPIWSVDVDCGGVWFYEDSLVCDRDYQVSVFDTDSGEEQEWTSDLADFQRVLPIGDQLVRVQPAQGNASAELMGIDAKGIETWESTVLAPAYFVGEGALFVADIDYSPFGVSNMMRVDPMTGESMWSAPIAEEGLSFPGGTMGAPGTVGGHMMLSDSAWTRFWSVDLDNGEASGSYPAVTEIWLGVNYFYAIDGENLVAFKPGQDEPVWELEISNREWVEQVGSHLVIRNERNHTISGLE